MAVPHNAAPQDIVMVEEEALSGSAASEDDNFERMYTVVKNLGILRAVWPCVLRGVTNGADDVSLRYWCSSQRLTPALEMPRQAIQADESPSCLLHTFFYGEGTTSLAAQLYPQ